MTALVVGGASGIGAAVVTRLRATGTAVSVWDIAGDADVTCDISDPAQVDAAIRTTVETIGVPSTVTVCAGIGHSGLLLDADPAQFDHVFGVNTKGVWLAMRAAARVAIDAEQPLSVVALSSVSAHLVDRNMGLYCASKAALSMLVRVAASEWAPHGIRVNAVGPGVTQTPMLGRAPSGSGWLAAVRDRTPLGAIGDPDGVAAAALALHDLTWVTGQVLDADGGLSLHSPIDSWGEAMRARGRTTNDR